jgi:opacity protein-like surface antigen
MKKFALVAALAVLFAAPAMAASTSVEFTNEAGEKQVWKFKDDGTAEGPEGAAATYTWDEATRKLCATFAGETPQTLCATFEPSEGEGAVGETTGYTLDDGRKGTAKIVAKEE